MLKKRRRYARLSGAEHATLLAHLTNARAQVEVYSGSWKASWLLTELRSPIWLIRTPATRRVNGEWKGTAKIFWDVRLADGTRLTEPSNAAVLRYAQETAFLVRVLPTLRIGNWLTHHNWISSFLTIIRWLFLHADLYSPRTHFLTRVEMASVEDFMETFVHGGTSALFRCQERFLCHVSVQALGREPSPAELQNPFAISAENRARINLWLEDAGFYCRETPNSSYQHLDRDKIARLLAVDRQVLTANRMGAVFRAFEPDLLAQNPVLLIPTTLRSTEHASHRTLTIAEALTDATAAQRIDHYMSVWRMIFRLHQQLPHAMPASEGVALQAIHKRMSKLAKPGRHTPWVPLKTALAYTREALRLVATMGEDLVSFYIAAVREFEQRNLWGGASGWEHRRRYDEREKWVASHVPATLKQRGISRWASLFGYASEDRFGRLRAAPSIPDALQVLVGAIIVLTAALKPIRRSELLLLRRDCIRFVDDDGFWLEHSLSKSSVKEIRTETAKPIPAIVATAVRQLARLGDALTKLKQEPDPFAREALFYLPVFHDSASLNPRLAHSSTLTSCVDRFCDYVGLPPDELGRRWYLRVHELRKSFLITLFWCFSYASLDAARWMAGQKDAAHLVAYIEANFPGEELPQLQADYAAAQLWDFETRGELGETENLVDLYQSVCHHFGVRTINLIAEGDLRDWLELAFREKFYRILPYTIEDVHGASATQIAFVVTEAKQL